MVLVKAVSVVVVLSWAAAKELWMVAFIPVIGARDTCNFPEQALHHEYFGEWRRRRKECGSLVGFAGCVCFSSKGLRRNLIMSTSFFKRWGWWVCSCDIENFPPDYGFCNAKWTSLLNCLWNNRRNFNKDFCYCMGGSKPHFYGSCNPKLWAGWGHGYPKSKY